MLGTILCTPIADLTLLQSSMQCSGQQWRASVILTLNYWLPLFTLVSIKSLDSVQSLEYPLKPHGAVITARINIVGVVVLALSVGKALNLLRLLIPLNTRSRIADIAVLSLHSAYKSC